MARYLSSNDLKKVKEGDIITERDITFRPDLEQNKGPTVVLDLLTVCQQNLLVSLNLLGTDSVFHSPNNPTAC